MALSGIISNTCNGSNGANYEIWAEWTVNSQSVPNNASNITVVLKLQFKGASNSTAHNLTPNNPVSLMVQYQQRVSAAISIDTRNKAAVTLASWTGTIPHAEDGTLALSIDGQFNLIGYPALTGGRVQSDTIEVTAIEKPIPDITFTVTGVNNKSIYLSAQASEMCVLWQFSVDNGQTWIDYAPGPSLSASTAISGLTPLTLYVVRVRALSDAYWVYGVSDATVVPTTGMTEVISKPPSFEADAATLVITATISVFSATFTHTVDLLDGETVITTQEFGTLPIGQYVKNFELGATQRNALLAYMSKVKTLQVTMRLSTKNSGGTVVGTTSPKYNALTSEANSKPLFEAISYRDYFVPTVALTGNDQWIVQGRSKLRVTAAPATARNGATIVRYTAQCANKVGYSPNTTINLDEINTENHSILTVTVADSRGYTESVSILVFVASYTAPKYNQMTIRRHNGVDKEIELSFAGSISPIMVNSTNKNNIMNIEYRIKPTSQTEYAPSSYVSILAACTVTGNNFSYSSLEAMILDPDHSYNIQVRVRDALNTLTANIYETIIPQGTPIIAIRPKKVMVDADITMNGFGILGTIKGSAWDFNELTEQGLYYFDISASAAVYPNPHMPSTPSDQYVVVLRMTDNKVIQIAYPFTDAVADFFMRRGTKSGGTWTWTSWVEK